MGIKDWANSDEGKKAGFGLGTAGIKLGLSRFGSAIGPDAAAAYSEYGDNIVNVLSEMWMKREAEMFNQRYGKPFQEQMNKAYEEYKAATSTTKIKLDPKKDKEKIEHLKEYAPAGAFDPERLELTITNVRKDANGETIYDIAGDPNAWTHTNGQHEALMQKYTTSVMGFINAAAQTDNPYILRTAKAMTDQIQSFIGTVVDGPMKALKSRATQTALDQAASWKERWKTEVGFEGRRVAADEMRARADQTAAGASAMNAQTNRDRLNQDGSTGPSGPKGGIVVPPGIFDESNETPVPSSQFTPAPANSTPANAPKELTAEQAPKPMGILASAPETSQVPREGILPQPGVVAARQDQRNFTPVSAPDRMSQEPNVMTSEGRRLSGGPRLLSAPDQTSQEPNVMTSEGRRLLGGPSRPSRTGILTPSPVEQVKLDIPENTKAKELEEVVPSNHYMNPNSPRGAAFQEELIKPSWETYKNWIFGKGGATSGVRSRVAAEGGITPGIVNQYAGWLHRELVAQMGAKAPSEKEIQLALAFSGDDELQVNSQFQTWLTDSEKYLRGQPESVLEKLAITYQGFSPTDPRLISLYLKSRGPGDFYHNLIARDTGATHKWEKAKVTVDDNKLAINELESKEKELRREWSKYLQPGTLTPRPGEAKQAAQVKEVLDWVRLQLKNIEDETKTLEEKIEEPTLGLFGKKGSLTKEKEAEKAGSGSKASEVEKEYLRRRKEAGLD